VPLSLLAAAVSLIALAPNFAIVVLNHLMSLLWYSRQIRRPYLG
jgi:hypothetical protein